MEFSIKHKPSYALLDVTLSPQESIIAEAGAMVYMDDGLEVKTSISGSFFAALLKKFMGGESLFINEFTATEGTKKIGFAPTWVGDLHHTKLSGNTLMMQAGAFVCSTPGIVINTKFGGLKSLFGGEGAFLLEASGEGDLFYSSYGAIIEIEVNGSYIIDTGHLVAFEPTLTYELRKVGGWKSTLLSGEGFVFDFNGNGKVWIQSRVPEGFVGWIVKLLPGT